MGDLQKSDLQNGGRSLTKIVVVDKCPGCGSIDFRPTGPEAPPIQVVLDECEFLQPSYSVLECSECGLLYRSANLSDKELSDYYARVDFHKWVTPGYYPTEIAALKILRRLHKGARILDFGCSSGRLLSGLVAEYDCHGLEINVEAAARASASGLKMLASDDLERSLPGSFDAITLMDVFEHLSEPTGLLKKLARLLKPGGLLIIVTGNGDSQVCRRDPAQFWYFRNVEHLSMFTRSYAEMLAAKIGAAITCWEEVSHYKMTPLVWVRQYIQDFAYWQFRSKTAISRLVLQQIPVLKRAKDWPVAPALTVTCDHVVAVFSPGRQMIEQ